MKSGYINSGSANIYYELYGADNPEDESKEVLVLLHGNGENIKFFKHQIPFFEKYYRVLCIDSRGHGESGFGKDILSLNIMATDVINISEKMGFESINVLGFSDGANIAMIAASRQAGLIKKLVLVGGNMNVWGLKIDTLAAILFAYACTSLAGFIDKTKKVNGEILALMVREPNLTKADLSCIDSDTLVIAGSNDMIRTSHTKKIASSIPKASLKIMDGDHFILFKDPEKVNEEILNFLQK
jgi:pimeloyl-ACP methyl ester carboxylesterase